MIDYQEQRIKQCLRCPIGHEILRGYSDFYLTVSDGHNKSEFTNRQKEIIKKLSSVLNISGTTAEQYEILYKLCLQRQELIDPNGDKLDCFCSLNQIISHLAFFFDPENTVAHGSRIDETLRKDGIDLTTLQTIKMMLECLPADIQKKYKESHLELKNIENANLATLKGNKNISAIVDSLKTIFKLYCEETDMPYQFCDPKYGYDLQNCHSDIFLSIATQQKALEIKELSEQSKAILEGYLKKIPKKFGAIFDKLMKEQGMGFTDITRIMGFAAPSKVQKLCEGEHPKLDISEIQKLARCLLVSEDVLTCGKGLRYGNWNNAFAGDGLKTLKKNCGTKSEQKTIQQWQNDVKALINVSSEEFEAMIDQHPEFFGREPFCLYDIYDEEDGVVYTDCREMIADALHPEEVEILLAVLKEHDRA